MTPEELERIAWLGEELCEAGHAIGKILRFGYDSKHPAALGGADPDNRDQLEQELGNILAALELMVTAGDLKPTTIQAWRKTKLRNVGKHLRFRENFQLATDTYMRLTNAEKEADNG